MEVFASMVSLVLNCSVLGLYCFLVGIYRCWRSLLMPWVVVSVTGLNCCIKSLGVTSESYCCALCVFSWHWSLFQCFDFYYSALSLLPLWCGDSNNLVVNLCCCGVSFYCLVLDLVLMSNVSLLLYRPSTLLLWCLFIFSTVVAVIHWCFVGLYTYLTGICTVLWHDICVCYIPKVYISGHK